MPRTVGVVFGLSIIFIYLHRLQMQLSADQDSILQELDSQVSGLPKTISHFPSLAAFSVVFFEFFAESNCCRRESKLF